MTSAALSDIVPDYQSIPDEKFFWRVIYDPFL